MLVYFNKKGVLKEQIDSYGNLPRVGTELFKIFAYFEGVDLTGTAAYIRLQKPNFEGTEYPALFMQLTNLYYQESVSNTSSTFFKESNNPYQCYLFDFSQIRDINDKPINLLDIAGLWKATITIIDSTTNTANVVGTMTFNVNGGDNESEAETSLSYNDVTRDFASQLANKLELSNPYYMRVWDNFKTGAKNGTLPAKYFSNGVVVFDKETENFYRVTSTTENAQNPNYLYAQYVAIFPEIFQVQQIISVLGTPVEVFIPKWESHTFDTEE